MRAGALNAEAAGAIGMIIINNQPGTIGMAGSNLGSTLPSLSVFVQSWTVFVQFPTVISHFLGVFGRVRSAFIQAFRVNVDPKRLAREGPDPLGRS